MGFIARRLFHEPDAPGCEVSSADPPGRGSGTTSRLKFRCAVIRPEKRSATTTACPIIRDRQIGCSATKRQSGLDSGDGIVKPRRPKKRVARAVVSLF